MTSTLSRDEIGRYARHIVLPDVSIAGQEKLKRASVLIVGSGGLGSPVAMYLAAAGVGRIGIVDFDTVDASNLQRQIVHDIQHVGKLKVESARQRLLDLNPYIQVDVYNEIFCAQNAERIAQNYDLLVDGSDNFPTRYLLNDLSVLSGKPYIYGSIFQFEGQVSVFDARSGPCYRCLFPVPPPPGAIPSCAVSGVFGAIPGIIGSLQAAETLKMILGIGTPLIGELLLLDALSMSFHKVKLKKNPDCHLCGSQPQITHLIDYEQFCGVPVTQAQQINNGFDISPQTLSERLKNGEPIRLIDVREFPERSISEIPNSLSIPESLLPERAKELDPSEEMVLFCRTGVRSARAVQWLLDNGFNHVKNLQGGINAWARLIDPHMAVY